MSTPPPVRPAPRASGAIRYFVPAYLLVCGAILFVLAVDVYQSLPEEVVVAALAAAGGVTMWLTAVAVAVLGRRD